MKTLRNFSLGCLGVVIVLVVAFTVWVRYPPVEDPAYYAKVIQEERERHEKLQLLAYDDEQNAFQHKEFVKYWGREGFEEEKNSQFEQVIKSWNEQYSSYSTGEDIDHTALLETTDEVKLKARDDFLAVLPELREVLSRPYFITPVQEFGVETVSSNLSATRSIALALSGHCEYLAAQKRYGEVVKELALIVRFGRALGGKVTMIDEMIAIAVRSIAVNTSYDLLSSEVPLSAQEWNDFARSLLENSLDKDAFLQMIRGEAFFQAEVWDSILADTKSSPQGRAFQFLVPGIMDREERLFINDNVNFMKAVEQNNLQQQQAAYSNFSWGNYFRGRNGFMSSIMLPNYSRTTSVVTSNRKQVACLATAAAIAGYKVEKGGLPKTIEQLDFGQREFEGFDELEISYTIQGDGGAELRVKLSTDVASGIADSARQNPWIEIDNDELVYKFPP